MVSIPVLPFSTQLLCITALPEQAPVTASSVRKFSKKASTGPRRRRSRASRMARFCGCPSSFIARPAAAAKLHVPNMENFALHQPCPAAHDVSALTQLICHSSNSLISEEHVQASDQTASASGARHKSPEELKKTLYGLACV